MADMTTVRMLVSITGTRDGVDWPERGATLELPVGEAAAMVAGGLVEVAAVDPDVEVAADVTRPAARRGRA